MTMQTVEGLWNPRRKDFISNAFKFNLLSIYDREGIVLGKERTEGFLQLRNL